MVVRNTTTVAVIGGTGYGGAELIRLLVRHPDVELVRVTSIDRVGEPLEAVHHNLWATGLTFENIAPAQAASEVDVTFLALPHKVSSTIASDLEGVAARIIDLSGDFRLRDARAYATFYGVEHPHPEELDGRWIYGLPELNRELISAATRVASPGCFATTVALGLLPIARAGLLAGPVQTVACTGSSGSGAYAKAGTHHPTRANNLKIYKPLTHQHTPEIVQTLEAAAERGGHGTPDFSLNFVPVSAPLTRGILANSFVRLPAAIGTQEVTALFVEAYGGEPFVRVLQSGAGRGAEVVAIKGSMYADLSFHVGPPDGATRQLVVTTAVDNLVKGGAGQAVQSMNLMLGLAETSGIDAPAMWP